ncbi:MAG: bifunctional adenosylcobinamide kinase/adenosylcobinamide-phosphate guanylyltransferase [Desulfobacterales bacterium]|nr:bifunctional adenosylcobinamide kinase/adenosylcobinamide-phosphate guanylyltransferase [Desulfobacterales bacterium]
MAIYSDKTGPKILFITGGARSGKSSFALQEASKISGKKLFIATAEPLDAEMKERIDKHRKERRGDWDTVEQPLEIHDTLMTSGPPYCAILIDCLTLWLSNVMGGHEESPDMQARLEEAINIFVKGLEEIKYSDSLFHDVSCIFIISNEVGMGIVPDNRLARIFRDMAGRLNQKVAKIADEVYLVVSGIPLRLKG